jgi:prepilin-type N-terminal cleavage/methylation domain-containing protein
MRAARSTQSFPIQKAYAFTLVELLVVIAVLALVIGILVPVIQMARVNTYQTTCANNLRQIGIGYQTLIDNSGRKPSAFVSDGEWVNRLLPYVGNKQQIFVCPSEGQRVATTATEVASHGATENSTVEPGDGGHTSVGLNSDGTLTVIRSGSGAAGQDDAGDVVLISPLLVAAKAIEPPALPLSPAIPPTFSYGVNNAAQYFGPTDQTPKVLALEYKQLVANVVGVGGSDFWPAECAPRHHGMLNVLFADTTVREMTPSDIDPRVNEIYKAHWLPQVLAD